MFQKSTAITSVLPVTVPEFFSTQTHELWYYIAGAIIFLLFGVVTGYFIWRRSHLQLVEMRHEKKNAVKALKDFGDEIEQERKMLEDSGQEIVSRALTGKRKRKKKKKSSIRKEQKPAEPSVSVADVISSTEQTTSIEPPENPVAKAMRKDAPKEVGDSETPPEKPDDDDDFF